jgi:hypothetical protein
MLYCPSLTCVLDYNNCSNTNCYDPVWGRTIPSFRITTLEDLKEWKGSRNGLGKSDKKLLNRIYVDLPPL